MREREFTVVRDNGHRRRDAEDGRNGRGQQHLTVYAVCDAADDGTAEGERQSPQHGHQRDKKWRTGNLERVDPERQQLEPPDESGQAAHDPDTKIVRAM